MKANPALPNRNISFLESSFLRFCLMLFTCTYHKCFKSVVYKDVYFSKSTVDVTKSFLFYYFLPTIRATKAHLQ